MGRFLAGVNDLRTVNSDVADQWHPTRNSPLIPEQITAGSGKKVWWQWECSPGIFHEWETRVVDMVSKGRGCPVCSGRTILVGHNDLNTTHPILAAQWHPTKNGPLTSEHVTAGANKKVWWERECSPGIFHEWETRVSHRALGGVGCSVCSGRTILVGHNDLSTTHPMVAIEWHPTKNGPLTSEHVTAGANKKVWWERECSPGKFHEWEATVNHRALGGAGCSVCSGRTILVGHNDLNTTHPILAAQWHPIKNFPLTTKHVTAGVNKKVWWECTLDPNYTHEWEATINNRSKGGGCPVCDGRAVLVGHNDLRSVHPAIAAEWHPTKNGSFTPEYVTAGSGRKVWWERECSPSIFHEWEATVDSRTKIVGGSGCPFCQTGKTETSFRESFERLTGYDWKTSNIQIKRLSRITNRAQIDMINEDLKIIIEYDGAWTHGKNSLYKTTLEQKLADDKETTEALVDYGYRVIRIREHDRRQKLPIIPIDPAYKSKVYQITYKSFGKDRDIIDDLAQQIIDGKADWFSQSSN